MDRYQRDFIIRNLPELVTCTKDLPLLGVGLLRNGIISQNTWEGILIKYPDSFTRNLKLYIECMESPMESYDLIIDILVNHGNVSAAEILRQIHDYSSGSESTSSISINCEENVTPFEAFDESVEINSSLSGDDFRISENGALKIKYILENFPRLEEEWLAVQFTLGLSGKSRGELSKVKRNDNFGNLVFKTVKLWRKEKVKTATFYNFIAVIADQNKLAAATLKQNRDKIRLA